MSRVSFREKVFAVVARIPSGSVMTYREVAVALGHPRAYRAVGNALNTNSDPNVPCHRVIRSDGAIGGYRGGTKRKREILRAEGAIK